MAMLKNQRWELFAQAVADGLPTFEAAEKAEIILIEPAAAREYYVYCLTDPRDGRAFYIGKGSRNRCYDHAVAVRCNREANRKKRERILDIHKAGLEPKPWLLANGLAENRAYSLEEYIIKTIGYEHLANLHPKEFTSTWRRMAILLLRLNKWRDVMERSPPSLDRDVYFAFMESAPKLLPYLRGAPLLSEVLQDG